MRNHNVMVTPPLVQKELWLVIIARDPWRVKSEQVFEEVRQAVASVEPALETVTSNGLKSTQRFSLLDTLCRTNADGGLCALARSDAF